MKGVGKMEINDVLMWHIFYCATCPLSGKSWGKLKNFEWERSRTQS